MGWPRNQPTCRYGHEYTVENTYYAPKRPTIRVCRACAQSRIKEWQKRNPDDQKIRQLNKLYGLTLAEFNEFVRIGCQICGSRGTIVVDHDHETGLVRGPLCNNCNWALGLFKDKPDLLRKAADYLDRHRSFSGPAEVSEYGEGVQTGYEQVEGVLVGT